MNINEVGPDGLDIGTNGLGDLGQIDSLGHHAYYGVCICTTYTYINKGRKYIEVKTKYFKHIVI